MKIVKRKVSEIKPYWRNPRNNLKAIEVVKESINEYGYTIPILVDKEGVIIAGHTRFKALEQLGYEEIDVIVSNMSEQKAKEFRIIDNKTSEVATWDYTKLMPEMKDIGGFSGFEGFFPELDLVSVGEEEEESDNAVTGKASSERKETKKKREKDQVEVVCPCCSEVFHVGIHELQEGLKAQNASEGIE